MKQTNEYNFLGDVILIIASSRSWKVLEVFLFSFSTKLSQAALATLSLMLGFFHLADTFTYTRDLKL